MEHALVDRPEIAIFLALGAGFWVGKFHLKGIGLGSVTGTLLVGVLIGATVSVTGADGTVSHIEIGDVTKQVFFLLFLFALGVRVGPQFFSGLKGSGIPQAVFTLVLIAVGLGTAIGVSLALDYNPGLGAGLAGGALTQSAIIGVAQDAIGGLHESTATLREWSSLVPVAYAVTYIFGTIGAAVYCSGFAPRLLGIHDLRAAAKEDEAKLGFQETPPDTESALERVQRRVLLVPEEFAGVTARELEDRLQAIGGARLHVDRTRKDGSIIEMAANPRLDAGDSIVLAAADVAVFETLHGRGFQEERDDDLLEFPIEELNIVVTKDYVAGKTLRALGQFTVARGIFPKRLRRSGHELPLLPDVELAHGDEVLIQGPRPLIEEVIPLVGYPERTTPQTDMIMVGLGIAAGALIGLPTVVTGNVPLSLTSSVGALLIGLLIGWRKAKSPTFGRIPPGTQWLFETVGLAAFVGIVGIDAGPGFVDGLTEYGVGLFLVGAVVTLVPLLIGTLLIRYVFRFDPVLGLGMLTGAQTTTAAVGAVREAAESSVPLLGFTVPYAVGNIVLTVGGAIVVAVLA